MKDKTDLTFITAENDKAREDADSAERLAKKRAAAERIAARRPVVPPDFDEKKELLDYLDEKYGV